MYGRGHVGIGLLMYAPIALVLIHDDLILFTLLGWGLTIFFSTFPDIDIKISFIPHRGPTHTVWFAVLFGIITGAIGGVTVATLIQQGILQPSLWTQLPVSAEQVTPDMQFLTEGTPAIRSLVTALFMGFVTAWAILSHLVGDVLTPMGIRPFKPFSNNRYTLKWTKAANTTANELLHYLGQFALLSAVFLGSTTARKFLVSFIR